MEIKILKTVAKEVADSIGEYIFAEAKTGGNRDIMWLAGLTSFYQSVKFRCDNATGDYVSIRVNEQVKCDLPLVISRHVFDELEAAENKTKDWLCEMMSIYVQLTEGTEGASASGENEDESKSSDDGKESCSEVGENYDSAGMFKKEEGTARNAAEFVSSDEITEEEETRYNFSMRDYEEEYDEEELV